MIDYLNLEINEHQKKKLTLDSNSLICYFPQQNHKHILHSEANSQANSIVDLLISQAENIKFEHNKHSRILQQLLEYFQKNSLITIRKNLDYISSQLEDNNKNIQRFPSRKEIKELIDLIDSKPKQIELQSLEIIEQLKLEVQKIKSVQQELSEQVVNLHSKIDRLLV
jgi:predicted  nucleic acid-binding Zn-ribbon protein